MEFITVGLRTIKRKNKVVYQVDYNLNGRRIRKVIGSNKKIAEAYQARIKRKLDKGELGISEKKIVSFDDLVEEYFNLKAHSLRPKSIARYKGFINDFNYFFKKYFPEALDDISLIKAPYILESIRTFRTKGAQSKRVWSASSANSYKTFIATLLKYAISKGYINSNPASEVPDTKVEKNIKIKIFSKHELDKIFMTLNDEWVDFFMFLLNTGIRLGEAINLKWDNVKLSDSVPKIFIISDKDNEWTTKTNTGRIVPLNSTAKRILEKMLVNKNEYVFTFNERKISKNKPYSVLKSVLNKLKINGNVHQFRHTFGTNFIIKNKDYSAPYLLMKIMGHKDLKTTTGYVHLAEEHLLKGMENLEG